MKAALHFLIALFFLRAAVRLWALSALDYPRRPTITPADDALAVVLSAAIAVGLLMVVHA